jgi:hypothetical protein
MLLLMVVSMMMHLLMLLLRMMVMVIWLLLMWRVLSLVEMSRNCGSLQPFSLESSVTFVCVGSHSSHDFNVARFNRHSSRDFGVTHFHGDASRNLCVHLLLFAQVSTPVLNPALNLIKQKNESQ